MIIELSIQNFGSIRERQTLSFEATQSKNLESHYVIQAGNGLRLLKLAMIHGANASGKTTILKALEFLRLLTLDPAEKKTEDLKFQPFLFDAESRQRNSLIILDFLHKDVRYSYHIEFNQKAVVSEELNFYRPNKANVYKRTTDIEKQFATISFGSKIKKDRVTENVLAANTLWNNSVLGGFLKTNVENHELREVQTWFSDFLYKTIVPESDLEAFATEMISGYKIEKTNVVEILKKADFGISDILISEEEKDIPEGLLEFLENQLKTSRESLESIRNKGKITSVDIELEHTVAGQKYTLPFRHESEGTKRYYGLAAVLALLTVSSAGFPIDELESSLHPDLYKHFIFSFLLNSKQSQLLCTTHNRELLNDRDLFRDDAIWFTDKSETNATELYSLADFDSKVIRDTSNVYNAYKIGKLGGVPNLGDHYIESGSESN